MNRVLVLGLEGVLLPWDANVRTTNSLPWLPLLQELLACWDDVGLVLTSPSDVTLTLAEVKKLLGSLDSRVIGSTFGMESRSAIEASVRCLPPVEHLVLTANLEVISCARLNVVVCDPRQGISSSGVLAALDEWLRRTASYAPEESESVAAEVQRRHRWRVGPYLPASPPKSAKVVLYLDLDGVLHHESVRFHPKRGIYMCPIEAAGHRLFEWAHIIIDILEPYPDLRLVLSSSWCVRPGYGKALKRIPKELRWRFIGGTYHRRIHGANPWTKQSFQDEPRGVQVCADAVRRRPSRWIALDDDVDGWPPSALEHLIACDGRVGLSDAQTQDQLRVMLREAGAT